MNSLDADLGLLMKIIEVSGN